MRFRFLEATDSFQSNHGKFALFNFGVNEWKFKAQTSSVKDTKYLLSDLRPVRRFGGGGKWTPTTIILFDLQTREGIAFDPTQSVEVVTRQFLVHPVHVCPLFFPVMRFLALNAARIWEVPNLLVLTPDDVMSQPGMLFDITGRPVQGRYEWSPRRPLVARLRNREVPEPEDDQEILTQEEQDENKVGDLPVW